jgi:hypothetical protein
MSAKVMGGKATKPSHPPEDGINTPDRACDGIAGYFFMSFARCSRTTVARRLAKKGCWLR